MPSLGRIELANKWLERLGGETEEMVNEAIGRIRNCRMPAELAARAGLVGRVARVRGVDMS